MLSIPISSYHSATTIVQLPLAFVRSGYVHVTNGRISRVGYEGDAWSHTTRSSDVSRYLYFSTSDVNPSDNGNRWDGFSLRCL